MNDTQAPLGLEWSMTHRGATLQVNYTLSNRTDRPILVFDALVVRGTTPGTYRAAPGRAVVTEPKPGTAGFFLCVTSAMAPIAWIVPPLLAPLEPHGERSASFEVPLPIASWHNLGPASPFRTAPKTATLRVAYLDGEPKWHELKGEDGKTLRVALNGSTTNVVGDEQPIPQ